LVERGGFCPGLEEETQKTWPMLPSRTWPVPGASETEFRVWRSLDLGTWWQSVQPQEDAWQPTFDPAGNRVNSPHPSLWRMSRRQQSGSWGAPRLPTARGRAMDCAGISHTIPDDAPPGLRRRPPERYTSAIGSAGERLALQRSPGRALFKAFLALLWNAKIVSAIWLSNGKATEAAVAALLRENAFYKTDDDRRKRFPKAHMHSAWRRVRGSPHPQTSVYGGRLLNITHRGKHPLYTDRPERSSYSARHAKGGQCSISGIAIILQMRGMEGMTVKCRALGTMCAGDASEHAAKPLR